MGGEAGRAPSGGLRSCACSRSGWGRHHHHHHEVQFNLQDMYLYFMQANRSQYVYLCILQVTSLWSMYMYIMQYNGVQGRYSTSFKQQFTIYFLHCDFLSCRQGSLQLQGSEADVRKKRKKRHVFSQPMARQLDVKGRSLDDHSASACTVSCFYYFPLLLFCI